MVWLVGLCDVWCVHHRHYIYTLLEQRDPHCWPSQAEEVPKEDVPKEEAPKARLMIRQIVLENFKSYGGVKVGSFVVHVMVGGVPEVAYVRCSFKFSFFVEPIYWREPVHTKLIFPLIIPM